jgi:hypothetical protein
MSEALIASQQAEINRLNSLISQRNDEAAGFRKKASALKKEVEAFSVEREKSAADLKAALAEAEEWKTKSTSSPDEWKAKAEEASAKLIARDHRDAWKTAVGDQLHDKVAVEKLWNEIGYQPGEAIPTPEQITEQISKAREAAPYLFKPVGSSPAVASVEATQAAVALANTGQAQGGGRSASDTSVARVTYSLSEVARSGWQRSRPELQTALANGTAVCVGE